MKIYYTHRFSGSREDSRKLLELAVTEHIGDPETARELVMNRLTTAPGGKPSIPGFECFSVSHSSNTWAALFSTCECGLDIQYVREPVRIEIADRFFAPADAESIRETAKRDTPEGVFAFFRIWVRREALIKSAGGSVTDSSAPSVRQDTITYAGRDRVLSDISIPGAQDLLAAVCLTEDAAGAAGDIAAETEFRELRMIEMNKNNKTAAETAYAYLAARMRTVRETEEHLKAKGFGSEEIRETVSSLKELGYLDDYQYALRYYEYNRDKHRGTLRASRELAEKGVDAVTVRNAREDFIYSSGVDEFEDALEAALKDLSLKEKPFNEKTAAGVARRLETRGYQRDIIFRVLDRLRSREQE